MIAAVNSFAFCSLDSIWNSSSCVQKITALQSDTNISEQCICKYLSTIDCSESQFTTESLISIIKKWASHNDVSNSILFAAYYNQAIHRNHTLWQTIVKLWDKSNHSPFDAAISLINSGEPLRADSLLRILDSEGKIDTPEILRWTKVKIIIKDFISVAPLYCRIIEKKALQSQSTNSFHQAKSIAFSQFLSQMEEIDKENAVQIIEQFKKCSLERTGADTMAIRSWLMQTYSRLEMYDKEINAFVSIPTSQDAETSASKLIDIAREHFLYHRFTVSLRAAKIAYFRSHKIETQSDAASILYRSFLSLGLQDSALIWLKKANITSEDRFVESIVLYQNAKQFKHSKENIDKLKPSFTKDTLLLRQYIMDNNFDKVFLLLNESQFLKRSPSDMLLWKIRSFLFCNKLSDVSSILDSIAIPVDYSGTTELLLYKYWLARLQDCPEVLATWGKIEYNIYIGMLDNCIPLIRRNEMNSECKWRLALRVACALHDLRKTTAAVSVMNDFEDSAVSAEFLYYKAQFLYETGEIEKAKIVFQRLVLDFSSDIFSGKARLFLKKACVDK